MEVRDTLVHRIADWAERGAERPAIWGKDASGVWQSWSWKQYWQDVRDFAKGLISLGVEAGECVALVGNNRPEWVIAEFGIMAARAIPAPIYTTNTPAQVSFILAHSQAKVAVCDDREQLAKYRECLGDEGVLVETIVTMDTLEESEQVVSFTSLLERGRKQSDDELEARLAALTEDETSLLIYTSGTTGTPKAVQLDHGGMIMIGKGITGLAEGMDHAMYRTISYLPLCHVAEQLFTNFMHLITGGQVYFCPDLKKLKEYLPEVRPTVFLGVPRVWEKFEAALRARLSSATGVKAKLASWALKTELASFMKEVEQGRPVQPLSRKLANKLVISKIKRALGLDELVIAATGAAPIATRTLEFFASLGVQILEGYGMSETTGVATANEFGRPRFGTVGKPLPGVEVRIAEDGEIQLKGRSMSRGYLRQQEETAELFTEDGWLCTGDLGELTPEGHLKITGRKKDLIITAGGKNVAPAEIEAYLKQIPGVGQAVVVGDRQPFLSALLVLDGEGLPELCARLDLPEAPIAELAEDPKVRAYFERQIEEKVNPNLARYQTVKKFQVLPVEFSVDSGELTPTMKIKRNVVGEKYAATIDGFYSDNGAAEKPAQANRGMRSMSSSAAETS
jgi:long-chain acyl-CoA synthetase